MIVVSGSSHDGRELQEALRLRAEISINYCISKGWTTNVNELTFDQILEIRSLDEWKNAPQKAKEKCSN